jgi:hypothetical protein
MAHADEALILWMYRGTQSNFVVLLAFSANLICLLRYALTFFGTGLYRAFLQIIQQPSPTNKLAIMFSSSVRAFLPPLI